MTTDKFCVNCKYFDKERFDVPRGLTYCLHPESESRKISVITGDKWKEYKSVSVMRDTKYLCGMEGKYFESYTKEAKETTKLDMVVNWFKKVSS